VSHEFGVTLPRVRLRIVLADGKTIGPGKADLLAAIEELGSIAAAGRAMHMSYQRAWSLVEDLNGAFTQPLVAASRGGSNRGGATLTETGRTILDRYRLVERVATERCAEALAEIGSFVKNAATDIT